LKLRRIIGRYNVSRVIVGGVVPGKIEEQLLMILSTTKAGQDSVHVG